MKLLRYVMPLLIAALVAFGAESAWAQATLLPPGEQCFSALAPTSGGPGGTGTGMVGLLGTITAGSGGTTGTYGGVALTGGHGSGATANITVSGGGVTAVVILNPGTQYVAGDALSASAANIGNVTGFSVPVSSVAINQSLAGGSVYYYVPGTSTFKQTWFNADQASIHQNTNPVTLDANGCAIVYGAGSYRQILEDSLGDIIWDQLTASTGTPGGFYWANLAGGTPNAITVVDPSFAGTDGQIIAFIPLSTNTGATTLNVSSYGAIPVVKDTATGAVALTGGEIVANSPSNIVEVEFSATQQNFHILNLIQASATATPVQAPQGYLNDVGVAGGGPIQGASDVTAATTIYYSPFTGNQIPIWNGASFSILAFPELQLALSASAQASNTIYDVCIFNNNGTPTAVFGPAWSNSAAGMGTRGTGAGSAQLAYQSGLLVNAVQIAANNGASTYTIPALQCTYVGSVFIDSSAGQVSTYRSFGQSRKWGIWNNYNQQPITLQAGDSTASWTYAVATIRPSNNNSANSITAFTGQAQEEVKAKFVQFLVSLGGGTSNISIGVGVNSTTAYSGTHASLNGQFNSLTIGDGASVTAVENVPPSIGINVINCLEDGSVSNTNTFNGTQANMVLTVDYRG